MFLSRQNTRVAPDGVALYYESDLCIYRTKSWETDQAQDNKLSVQYRKLLSRDSAYLFLCILLICTLETRKISTDPLNYSIFNIVFEVIRQEHYVLHLIVSVSKWIFKNLLDPTSCCCNFSIRICSHLPVHSCKRVLVCSAYGNVGMSMGYSCALTQEENVGHSCEDVPYSLSGKWSANSKILLVAVMLVGRHRGLPDNIDSAIILPRNFITNILDTTCIYNHKKLNSNSIHNTPAAKDSQSFHNTCIEELSERVYSNWICTHMYRAMETRLSNTKIKSENVVITSFTHSKASHAKECNWESILPRKRHLHCNLEKSYKLILYSFVLGLLSRKFNA